MSADSVVSFTISHISASASMPVLVEDKFGLRSGMHLKSDAVYAEVVVGEKPVIDRLALIIEPNQKVG